MSRQAVMVVEDDHSMMMIIEDVLQAEYDVIPCSTAERALDTLKAGVCPDLILVDYRLPGMNGAEFAKAVHQLKEVPPMVLLTAFVPEAIKEPLTTFIAVTEKPTKIDGILDIVKKHLAPVGV